MQEACHEHTLRHSEFLHCTTLVTWVFLSVVAHELLRTAYLPNTPVMYVEGSFAGSGPDVHFRSHAGIVTGHHGKLRADLREITFLKTKID